MPRTSGRRWKGCALCKPQKHAGNGDAQRSPWAVQRKLGRRRRMNRSDVTYDA